MNNQEYILDKYDKMFDTIKPAAVYGGSVVLSDTAIIDDIEFILVIFIDTQPKTSFLSLTINTRLYDVLDRLPVKGLSIYADGVEIEAFY